MAWRRRGATWDAYVDPVKLESFTPKSLTTREAVTDELRVTRERGYAISDEDVTPGVASIGVPIFDHAGTVKAALSIGGLREPILEGSRALGRPPAGGR